MVQANNPFETALAIHQQQLAATHIEEPMSENCGKARNWIAQHFQPFICVYSSKSTQKRMQDTNGFTPAEFLRPFGEVGNLSNYLVRTCEKNGAYKLNRFRVNFIDSHLMSDHPKPSDRIPERIISEHKPKVRSEMANIASFSNRDSKQAINANLQNLIGMTRQATEQAQTPWFTMMKRHLYQSNRFGQHELTQQPIAFIYFLSVEDKDPLVAIDRLRTTEMLPKQYRQGVYDNSKANLKQFVFILNDTNDEARVQTIKGQIAKQFAESIIHEIRMSGERAQPKANQDLWERYLDLDVRAFDKNRIPVCGTSFSQNDRTHAQVIVRRIIEKILLPFSVARIQSIEANIAKTRKGISKLFRMFKSSDRGENDGMQSNFRMNRAELELRTLTDLSFVIQDYETTYTNAEYPSSDFKRIKAYLHAAHCDEIKLYARIAHERFYAQNNIKDVVQTANGIYEMYSKGQQAQQNSSQSLIRFSLMMAELLQQFGEHDHAATFFVRLANKLADKAILKAMCFEQAAYEYLILQQFRKFSYFMTLAGQAYERMGQRDLKNYSFNCFTIVHPFYQARKGWNRIQFQLYSLLGANSEIADGDSHLAVQFFRNLLLLTHQFDDVNQQRQCLTASLQAFRKFQQESEEASSERSSGSNIGYLELPQILPHTIEVFADHEKVLTNLKESKVPLVAGGSYFSNQGECDLIEHKFINFNGYYRDESAVERAQKEAAANGAQIVNEDINQSNIPWRILEKQITDYIRKNHGPELANGSEGAYAVNGDEMTECGIYDATCLKDRTDTTYKRQRKVYKDKEIRVRFMLRNPLLTDISISNLRLCCRYIEEAKTEGDQAEEERKEGEAEFMAEATEMQLPSQEQVEVILKVTPYKTGEIVIEQIRWELYDIFKCEYDLTKSEHTKSEVRPEFRSVLPRQLIEKEKIFSYKVLPPSAEISASIELQNNGNLPRLGQNSRLVFSETDSGMINIKNQSNTHSIRNIFALCSHPIIFDLYIKKLLRDTNGQPLELGPNEEAQVPINFRATLKKDFSVRFLFRYESVPQSPEAGLPATCRFRFQRMIIFINSQCLFAMNPAVHMSVREPDQYIVNLMTLQKLNTTWYERPHVTSIEAIRGANRWCLSKKDDSGNFFIVKPRVDKLNDSIDEIPGAQLGYLRESLFVGDVLEGLDGDKMVDMDSLTKDNVALTFMERESDHMENTTGKRWRKTEGDAENEQIDLVVRWRMREKGKAGFITLFGVQLLKDKKQLTNNANKIREAQQVQMQRTIRQSGALSAAAAGRTTSSSRLQNLADSKILPIRVTYDFQQHVTHHFTEQSPSKQVKLVINIQNLLQSDELCKFSCHVIANQSWKKGKGRYSLVDVSEGESFLWVGKTTHKLQNFKPNETKRVVLRANLPRQGLFNLNRFNIIIKQLDCAVEQRDMLQNEYKVRDALVVQVQDPIAREKEDSDQLLLQLTDNLPGEFSK